MIKRLVRQIIQMSSETIKPKTKQDKNKTRQDSQTRLLFSMPEVGEHSILLILTI